MAHPVSIYLSMFVDRFSLLQTAAVAGRPAANWHSMSTYYILPDCSVCTVHKIFAGVTKMSFHYHLSPTVQIYHRRRHTRSRSVSQKDYQLVYKCRYAKKAVKVVCSHFFTNLCFSLILFLSFFETRCRHLSFA